MSKSLVETQDLTGDGAIVPADNRTGLIRPVASPAQLIEHHKEAVEIIREALQEGKDYGVIPGAGEKPGLFKAGAERLLAAFGLYFDTDIIESEIDHHSVNDFAFKKWINRQGKPANHEELKSLGIGRNRKTDNGWKWQECVEEAGTSRGCYRYVVKGTLRLRSSGAVMGTGIGSCSSMESKYLRTPRDFDNTILKMAKKRALVDATLSTLGMSDRFTQDVEDMNFRKDDADDVIDAPAEILKAAPPADPDGEAKSFLSPEQQAQVGRMKDAGAFLKQSGFNAAQYAEFTKFLSARKASWVDLAIEAREVGCVSREQIVRYVEDGVLPTAEGEVVATPAPAAVGPEPNSSSDAVEPPSGDPFGDTQLALLPDQKREIIQLIKGSGLTLEDILNVAQAENVTTFDDAYVVAVREVGQLGAAK